MKIKIYSRLSLSEETIRQILPDAICAGPIKRSDILNDIKDGRHILGIVDGEFQQSLAVSPSEILDALRCGLKVYGSSSMGALRAAECAPFGMIGVGRIFEEILSQPYFEDDLLGQIFDPSGKMKSMPYIDFQFAVARQRELGNLSASLSRQLLSFYKELHFSERSVRGLMARPKLKSLKNYAQAAKALEEIATSTDTQKHLDGVELLKRIAHDVAHTAVLNARLADAASG